MPPADAEYLEMSTAKAWHQTPDQWRCLSADCRARMVAHEIIEGKRSGYYSEMLEEKSAREAKTGGQSAKADRPVDPLFALMNRRIQKK